MPDTDERPGEITLATSLPRPLATAPVCANCEVALNGPYCSNCGQHSADFHRSVWRFVSEFFDNTICWDNKLFRTLGPLLKYPGLLTHDFMEGRRVRYVHPLRLFIFTSAVCLAFLQYSHDSLGPARVKHPARSSKRPAVAAESPGGTVEPKTAEEPADAAPDTRPGDNALGDSIRATVGKIAADARKGRDTDDDMDNSIDQMVKDRVAKAGGQERFSRTMAQNFQQRLSWVAFALLPVFAFGLRAVYWRRDFYYFTHLIFSLHYHTFLLLFWTAYTALVAIAAFLPLHSLWEVVARVCLLWPPVYLYLSLRRMYADSRRRTVLKVVVLSSLHLLAIVIGVAAVGAMAFVSTGG